MEETEVSEMSASKMSAFEDTQIERERGSRALPEVSFAWQLWPGLFSTPKNCGRKEEMNL